MPQTDSFKIVWFSTPDSFRMPHIADSFRFCGTNIHPCPMPKNNPESSFGLHSNMWNWLWTDFYLNVQYFLTRHPPPLIVVTMEEIQVVLGSGGRSVVSE